MGSSAEPSEGVATHKTGSGYFTRSEVFECSYRRNDPSESTLGRICADSFGPKRDALMPPS
jgi:hypothetical protein